MPAYWLLKSEPDNYSYDDLERDGATVWDGVANNAALLHIRKVQPGDLALIYHTGDERCAVGLAEITGEAYADPKQGDAKLVVMDVRALRRLPAPVTLAAIKADPFFADFALVRQARLSVVPVTEAQWARIMQMAGAAPW
jgi:predicted RNA-binding protein with PUA-like domain